MQEFVVMVSEARRAAIRKFYRTARIDVDKTQMQVETLARLDAGRYWKIENGFTFPTEDERPRIAKALKANEADLPTAEQLEKAS